MSNSLKPLHIYLISDCSGESLQQIIKSVGERFKNFIILPHYYPLIKSSRQIDKIITYIKKVPGILMYTIMDNNLRFHLKQKCTENNIETISVLAPIILKMSEYFQVDLKDLNDQPSELEQEYFQRMEAINFSIKHDDGKNYENLEKADILLLGVSRTSKTPTSIYLANKGFKTANIPFISGSCINNFLEKLQNPLIIGLTISYDRLVDIRKSRIINLNNDRSSQYAQIDEVSEEINQAKRFFTRNNWPIIDVTRRSVEETAAKIIHYYNKKFDNTF